MRLGHQGLGQCCLLLLLLLVACESPAARMAEATRIQTDSPTEAGSPATPQAVEETLLYEIAGRICPYPDRADKIDPYERYFTIKDPVFTLICYPAAGHSTTVTIRRFADPAEARAEFESVAAPGSAEDYLGFPVSDWEEQHPSFPDGRYEYRVRLMQAGPWLIWVRSFDDTHFLIARDPREASIAILQVVKEHGLPPILDEPP